MSEIALAEIGDSQSSANHTEKGQYSPPAGSSDGAPDSDAHDGAQQLPPMDSGMNAWLFLAACFVMEALVWGFAFTYGVFQEYYSAIPEFKDSGNIAVVGTCAMVISHTLFPL